MTHPRELLLESNPIEASRRRAFSETCDPTAYVPRDATEYALAGIRVWGESDEPGSTLAAIVGTPGLGKTMLLRVTESRVNAGTALRVAEGETIAGRCSDHRALYLPYAGLSISDLAIWVHGLLGIASAPTEDLGDPEVAFRSLTELGGGPRDPFFLMFDDADSMPPDTVRTLVEGLPNESSPLRILLALNPDSKATRLFSALHPLLPAQISFRTRMTEEETATYLKARMDWAELPPGERAAFDDQEVARIYTLSSGVPRRVHALASARLTHGLVARPSALEDKQRREDWMGRPIEDELED